MLNILSIIVFSVPTIVFMEPLYSSDVKTVETVEKKLQKRKQFPIPPYPRRNDLPILYENPNLRYENITDIEIREIEIAVQQVNPGAIVNIGGVTVGCPCEDGEDCTNQVWVVAYTPTNSNGVMYSKIKNHWKIGPVQGWWLKYESLIGKWRDPKRWKKPREWYTKN